MKSTKRLLAAVLIGVVAMSLIVWVIVPYAAPWISVFFRGKHIQYNGVSYTMPRGWMIHKSGNIVSIVKLTPRLSKQFYYYQAINIGPSNPELDSRASGFQTDYMASIAKRYGAGKAIPRVLHIATGDMECVQDFVFSESPVSIECEDDYGTLFVFDGYESGVRDFSRLLSSRSRLK
jgi:hypothetical protein